MDLSKIDYFLRAAEYENFTQAAEVCHIGQTTMSKYIRNLERQMGFPLFVREKKTVRLTERGRRFYEGMKAIQREYRELLSDLQRADSHEIHIGIALQEFLQLPAMRGFETAHPEMSVYYAYVQDPDAGDQLERGKLDALIVPDALAVSARYSKLPVLELNQSLVCAEMAIDQYGSPAEMISAMPLITKSSNSVYHTRCIDLLRQHFGTEPAEILVCGTLMEQLLQIGTSRGFGILPSAEAENYEGMWAMPLERAFCESVNLVYEKSSLTEGGALLLDYIQQAINHEKKC